MTYIKIDFVKEQLFLDIAAKLVDSPVIRDRRISNNIVKQLHITGMYKKDPRYRMVFSFEPDTLGGLNIKCDFTGNYEYFSTNSSTTGFNSSTILPSRNQSKWDEDVENNMKFLYKKAVLNFRPSVP